MLKPLPTASSHASTAPAADNACEGSGRVHTRQRGRRGAAAFRAQAVSASSLRQRIQGLAQAPGGALCTVFQDAQWLEDWHETLGRQPGLWPVTMAVSDAASGRDLLLLPLVAQRSGGVTLLRAPDQGVADYHWPIVARQVPFDDDTRPALWAVLKQALARQGDLLRLGKMLPALDNQTNPLLGPLPSWPSESIGHHFEMPDGHAAWLATLSRQSRREFARHWRLFQAAPDARFERITRVDEGLALLAELERLQAQRLGAQSGYRLGEAPYQQFYARRLRSGLAQGDVVMTALRAGTETVAVAYGLRRGTELTLVRVAFGDPRWKPCAPGVLLMERTAEALSHDGVKRVDLSIGSYGYKRSFGCSLRPLRESCVALTWRGSALATAWQTRQRLASFTGARENAAPCREPNSNY
ncbi:MAG: GNAT family N-acetyltransferase [Rubrivivax sp.]|nr:GNAT family N-acetyltransferase [Rubrivivax sp.]